MQKGFVGAALTPEEAEFNREMSIAREPVEWGYKDIKQVFSLNDFPRQMKVLKSPIGLMMIASAGIANIRCCLYQSQTGRYFDCLAPRLEKCLRFEAECEE